MPRGDALRAPRLGRSTDNSISIRGPKRDGGCYAARVTGPVIGPATVRHYITPSCSELTSSVRKNNMEHAISSQLFRAYRNFSHKAIQVTRQSGTEAHCQGVLRPRQVNACHGLKNPASPQRMLPANLDLHTLHASLHTSSQTVGHTTRAS